MNLMRLFYLLFSCSGLLYGKGVQDAGGYHNHSRQQWDLALEFINAIPLQGQERILDVGCGDGKITALIASKIPHGNIVGVDISKSMVEFASSQYGGANLQFEVGDGANLNFEGAFDVVVSFSTLHWVLDQDKALDGIYKALAPEGKAYITTYGKAPMNFLTVSEKLVYSNAWSSYFPDYQPQRVYFTAEEYQSILNRSGFKHAQLTTKWIEYPVANREAAFQYAKPLINFIGHLSPELQNKFLNELVDEFIQLAKPTEDGSIVFRFQILQVVAEKETLAINN